MPPKRYRVRFGLQLRTRLIPHREELNRSSLWFNEEEVEQFRCDARKEIEDYKLVHESSTTRTALTFLYQPDPLEMFAENTLCSEASSKDESIACDVV